MEALIPFILITGFLLSFANLGPFSTRQSATVNPEVVVQEKTLVNTYSYGQPVCR